MLVPIHLGSMSFTTHITEFKVLPMLSQLVQVHSCQSLRNTCSHRLQIFELELKQNLLVYPIVGSVLSTLWYIFYFTISILHACNLSSIFQGRNERSENITSFRLYDLAKTLSVDYQKMAKDHYLHPDCTSSPPSTKKLLDSIFIYLFLWITEESCEASL